MRPQVAAAELRGAAPGVSPVDEVVLELLTTAKHVRQIRVVNGRRPGALTAALAGTDGGTVIHTD